jgi:tetratricopeptide (TPR) repeat protein
MAGGIRGIRRARQEAGEVLIQWCAELMRSAAGNEAKLVQFYPHLKESLFLLCSLHQKPLDDLRWYAERALSLMNLLGDWQGAIDAIEQAFADPRREQSWPEGSNWLAWFYELQARFDKAECAARRALAVALALNDSQAVFEATMRLAKLRRSQGDYEGALALYADAGKVEGVSEDQVRLAYLLSSSGLTHWHVGQWEAALDCLRQAEDAARQASERRRLAQILNNQGLVLLTLGSFEEAEERLRSGLAIAEDLGDQREIGVLCGNMGELYLHMDRLEEALYFEQKSETLASELGGPYRKAKAKIRLSAIWRAAGDRESLLKARDLAREAAAIGVAKRLHHFDILGSSYEALAESLLGNGERAIELSSHALSALAEKSSFDGSRIEILFNHVRVLEEWDPVASGAALADACELLRQQADQIGDEDLRRKFLERVPLHRSVLESTAQGNRHAG